MILSNQIVYVAGIAFIVAIIFLIKRNAYKYILGLAIVMTPWQGGLWIAPIRMDFMMSTVLYIIVFIFMLIKGPKSPIKKRLFIPVLLPFLGILIGSLISISTAYNPPIAFSGPYMFVIHYFIFYCIFNMLQTPRDIKFVLLPLVISLIFQGVLALIQFRFWGFKIGVIDGVQSWMVWRSKGTFFHANALGMYLILVVPLAFRLTLMAFRSKKRRKVQFYLFVFILGTAALFATQNRGSWIGFTFAMVAMFLVELYRNRTKMRKILSRLIIPMGIILLIFTIRYGSFFIDRLFRGDASLQVRERTRMQKDAIKVIKQYPVFGVGIMNYIHHNPAGFVHNLYLLITAEIGFWGLFCYLWFFFIIYLQTRKADKSSNIFVKNMSMGIETAILGFMISSLSSPDYLKNFQIGMHVWILAGLIAGMNKLSDKYNPKSVEDYFSKNKEVDEEKKQKAIVQVKKSWSSII